MYLLDTYIIHTYIHTCIHTYTYMDASIHTYMHKYIHNHATYKSKKIRANQIPHMTKSLEKESWEVFS